MSAIKFVVRDSMGNINRGDVAGDGAPASLFVTEGQDISLNLRPTQITSYERNGQALEITLIDGRVVVIEGFFSPEGVVENRLVISADGTLSEVILVGDGSGQLAVQYADADEFGKYSPNDQLYFLRGQDTLISSAAPADDEAAMLAAPLMGGIGGMLPLGAALGTLGAVGALAGGGDGEPDEGDVDGGNPGGGGGDGDEEGDGGGGGGGNDTIDETDGDEGERLVLEITGGTVETGDRYNEEDHSQGVTIEGTGNPGATVEVEIGGVTRTVEVDSDSNWRVTFNDSEVPGGDYETAVTVTITKGELTETETQTVDIDTITSVTFEEEKVGGDGVVNGVEHAAGVTLTGQTEAGATVVVEFNGTSYNATVSGTTWTLEVSKSDLTPGEYEQSVTVTTTDSYGNTASTSGSFTVDTFVNDLTHLTSPVGGSDAVVNNVESEAGMTLSGTVEPGSTVTVSLGGTTKSATVKPDGTWDVSFPADTLGDGEYETTLLISATDAAGNTASISETVTVDTFVNELTHDTPVEGDDVINAAEASDGVTLTGTVEAGSTVEVTFDGMTKSATVDENGNWSVSYAASDIRAGEYEADIEINATDAAGNTRSMTDTVTVDTVLPEAPFIESFSAGRDGLRDFGATLTDDTTTVSELTADGQVSTVGHTRTIDRQYDEVLFELDSTLPNGSHLIVSNSDDAGNSTATLFVQEVIDNENGGIDQNDVSLAGLEGVNIGAIDLGFAEDSVLTLTASDLEGLSDGTNTLVVHGGSDDFVNIAGGEKDTGADPVTINGRSYDTYTLGDNGGTLLIDEEISVSTAII